MVSGSEIIRLTVILGLRDEKGSWNTICIFRRRSLNCFFVMLVISFPLKKICPPVLSSRWRMVLPSVDLPHPLSPTTPRVCPRSRLKLIPSTACSIPFGVLKYFLSSLTSSSTSIKNRPPFPPGTACILQNGPALLHIFRDRTAHMPPSSYRSGLQNCIRPEDSTDPASGP